MSRDQNVIMCNLFFKLFTGYQSKPEQTTNCSLSATTSCHFWPAYLSDLPTVYTPSYSRQLFLQTHSHFICLMLEQKPFWPMLILLLSSKAMEYSPFTFNHRMPSKPLKLTPTKNITAFKFCLLPSAPTPQIIFPLSACVCVWSSNTICSIFFSLQVLCTHFCQLCKVLCADPCPWDTALEMTAIIMSLKMGLDH